MTVSTDQHVEYILLAEFDIDKGASLAHQYPNPPGTDEGILAELMLPDGAHMRSEDWTIFFLNQRIPDPENIDAEDNQDEADRKPLLYVLNLVRTKHDASVKRGAMVKAMAICTRHQYLHIYKPLLLLALDNYFQTRSIATLEFLYKAVNSMDLSQIPHFTWHEKQILRAFEGKDMFEEKFVEMEEGGDHTRVQSFAGNLQTSMVNLSGGEDHKRGTYIDLASGQRREVLHFSGKDRHFFETKVVYDGIKLPIRVPLTLNPEEVGDFSMIKLISTFTPTTSTAFQHPHHPHLDSSGPLTHPVMLLLNALLTQKRIVFLGYGHPSGEVANYVLAACAMGIEFVTNTFDIYIDPHVSPGFIAGVTNPTFQDHPSWWDVLCDIDTGKIIVSRDIEISPPVTRQPRDPDRLDDNSHTLNRAPSSNSLLTPPIKNDEKAWGKDGRDLLDSEFMADVTLAIQSHYGEMIIRAKFQDYMQRFVRLAAVYEEEYLGSTKIGFNNVNTPDPTGVLGMGVVFTDDTAKNRELIGNINRIEGWRSTISYQYYQKDFQKALQSRSIKNIDMYRQISKLKMLKMMPDNEVETIYKAFLENAVSEEQMHEVRCFGNEQITLDWFAWLLLYLSFNRRIQFLSYLPQHQGGLVPLGFGLFHPSRTVRQYTVDLFNRLGAHTTGNRFIQTLNRFQKLAYERLCHSLPQLAGSGGLAVGLGIRPGSGTSQNEEVALQQT
ncbi:hypothetical protein BC936DRAFT_137837 [Jimgerdemannia flammicorona]|uniref:UDENN domain-containing protein n=1 Tax=Jimgerdemannia flammicorona TaxID=994334 RepID=A0A433CWJ6_9FUNG|nr:hypothetical protein BC936DRAFT_137837 [Jimgerdemannia flammicorona]